jgi:D-alanyl-D-alanine carboxypeptidase (penicillin-binding protein 5/6)
MLTALLVRSRATPAEVVTVSARAATTGGGGLDLHAGERYTVGDLLYALLLTSSNDAAVALAEHVAGSEGEFVAAMNDRAARLGLEGSRFVSPHGLDRPGHFSTATDLARLAARLLRDDLLARVVRTRATTIRHSEEVLQLANRNPLLETYRGAIGVKTGFTDAAGDVLVAAARRAGRRLIAVAMGSRDAARDCRRLLDHGFARLRRSLVVRPRTAVGWLVYDPAGAIAATAARSVRGAWHPHGLRVVFRPAPGIRPPVDPGEPVGRIVVAERGRPLTSVPALAGAPLAPKRPDRALEALGGVLRAAHALADALGLG